MGDNYITYNGILVLQVFYSHLKRGSLEFQTVFLVTSLAELITNTSPSTNTARYLRF